MKERNLLYEKVLEILATDGWVNSIGVNAKYPYTLISAFWTANKILKIEKKMWHEAFDHMRDIIYNQYPERVSQRGTIVSDFGGHKDTIYEDVVKVLQLAMAPTASPVQPTEGEGRKIKFREWF